MWLPYLPAVASYHYPIFSAMDRSPGIKVTELGFVIDPSAVAHWSNVESVIQTTIQNLRYDATTCRHRPPAYPSQFGYRRTFSKRKDANAAAKHSLLAFHHMLAYCLYLAASSNDLHFPQSQQKLLYENPAELSALFEKIDDSRSNSHTLLKLLWSSLGEIRQTRNFAGVFVTYDMPYDCQSIQDMYRYGVPVYIRWPNRSRTQSYFSFPQGEILARWRPPVGSLAALDRLQHPVGPQPATHPVQQPPPPPPPTAFDQHDVMDPWEYVERRKAEIASKPSKSQSWLDREERAKSFSQPGQHGARVYQFTLVGTGTTEEGTGREIQEWKRVLLTRSEARLLWDGVKSRNLWYGSCCFSFSFPLSESGLRYDCERDQWIHCYEFSFTENAGAHEQDSDSDDDDGDGYMQGPPPPQPRQNDRPPLHSEHPVPHHEVDSQMVDDFPPEQNVIASPDAGHQTPLSETDSQMVDDFPPEQNFIAPPDAGHQTPLPETDGNATHDSLPEDGITADPPAEAPSFNGHAHLEHLLRTRHDAPSDLTNTWKDATDFFHKRYGLRDISEENDATKSSMWPTRLGIERGVPSTSAVKLHDSVVNGDWPPSICDLSPGLTHGDSFPTQSPDAVLRITPVLIPKGYLVSFGSARDVSWRVFIWDSLTLLQIEREGWDRDPHAFIINMIKKGVPFQILNPQNLEGARFYDHPGPTVHVAGKQPQHVDYLAYRQELTDFFARYPHAYAAALSGGGILWRIAMDVLPIPDEFDVTRRFHPYGCISQTIHGIKYWTPKLTLQEEEVIVGVYKWAASKSSRESSRDSLLIPSSSQGQS